MHRLAAVLVCLLAVSSVDASQGQLSAVQGLLYRLLPTQADSFVLSFNTSAPVNSNATGFFVISSAVCPETSAAGCVSISGSDAVAISSGIHHYLKYVANCSVSWYGDQLVNIPLYGALPQPAEAIYKETTYTFRYYMNTCTFGYSTFAWDFARWQREIDWMALNSINMPLAFVGQEYVFQQVYMNEFNFTVEEVGELFTGPAFLPWNRMGNIQQWLGPLPQYWLEAQRGLQVQILEQMRAFGMIAVLPAFSGLVPPSFQTRYPQANITIASEWGGVFKPTSYLNPTDPLFKDIQVAFLKAQNATYGSDHYYNCDLYNEMRPISNSTEYLSSSTAGVYEAMIAADPQAVWVMQGWLFLDTDFWQNAQISALVHAVPRGGLLILDLNSETTPIWNQTESFFGTPFIWNMLHNFGGRTGMYGRMPAVATWPAQALATNATTGSLYGIGLTPEAIESNPVMYDLMMENTWRGLTGVPDLNAWIDGYVSRRYGGYVPSSMYVAWHILQNTVYNCNTTQMGTSGSIFASAPGFNTTFFSCCAPVTLYYDAGELPEALLLFLEAGTEVGIELTSQATYQYDLVLLTSQVMSNVGIQLNTQMSIAYTQKDLAAFTAASGQFIELMTQMDALMGTQELFLLGTWLADAMRWGVNMTVTDAQCDAVSGRQACGASNITMNDCELVGCCYGASVAGQPSCFSNNLTDIELLARNARTQVTLWGPQDADLTEYAYKLWNGLIGSYYVPRWEQWIAAVSAAISSGSEFNESTFLAGLQVWEENWTRQSGNPFMQVPQGNAFALASAICREVCIAH